MAWTAPKNWTTGEALTASDMNVHIKDNLNALKTPPTAHYECNEGSDYQTTSTSFVDVDGTNLRLTITTTGGDVLVGFCGSVNNGTNPSGVYLNIHESVAGGVLVADDGILSSWDPTTAAQVPISFVYLVTGLAAGEHIFKLQWKVYSGTATMYAGAGTGAADVHHQFWAREVS